MTTNFKECESNIDYNFLGVIRLGPNMMVLDHITENMKLEKTRKIQQFGLRVFNFLNASNTKFTFGNTKDNWMEIEHGIKAALVVK